MAGNANSGKRQEKLWRDALLLAVNAPGQEGKKKLRHIAETVVRLAMGGDMVAVKEIGDRLDGRPHQTVEASFRQELCEIPDAELAAIIASGGGEGVAKPKNRTPGPDSVH